MKSLILFFLSFNVLANCGVFFFNQRSFQIASDESKIFHKAPKFSVNGVELQAGEVKRKVILFENGTAAEGPLSKVIVDDSGHPAYLGFNGQTQLLATDGKSNFKTLAGQDYAQHAGGFGMPVGSPSQAGGDVTWWTAEDWKKIGVAPGKDVKLTYPSGVIVTGKIKNLQTDESGMVRVLTFVDGSAEAVLGETKLFQKDWGTYDVLIGTKVINETVL